MTTTPELQQNAKQQVEKDLIALVGRFSDKADAARKLGESVGMVWRAYDDIVMNEHGVKVANCCSDVAANVVVLYSPEKILGASQSKGKIAQQLLDSFTEERYEDLLVSSFVAHILIEDYRGKNAATIFSNAVKAITS
jgi:hypothetical protein